MGLGVGSLHRVHCSHCCTSKSRITCQQGGERRQILKYCLLKKKNIVCWLEGMRMLCKVFPASVSLGGGRCPTSAAGGGEEGAAAESAGAAALSTRPERPILPSPSPRLRARLRSAASARERRQRWVCSLAPLRGGLWLERFPWMLPSWSLAEE